MPDSDLPLRRSVLHILLALSSAPRHGLGIADEVERITDGTIRLGPGTLYRSLKEMAERSLIEEVPGPDDADPRRRYYEMTAQGRALLNAEVGRLDALVRAARERDVVPEAP